MTGERECLKWACPGPTAVLKCRKCGGCCEWWNTPHLTKAQVAGLSVGARFEADYASRDCLPWEVTAVEGSPRLRLSVKPLAEAPRGRYWFEVEECGALHYWYELKGEGNQGGCGGTRRFAEMERMGQAVLL